MQLTVQKPKSSGYAAFVICLILAIVGTFFLVLPKYGAYKDAKAQAANSQNTLDDVKRQQQVVNDLLSKLKQRSDDLQRVDLALPDQADIPDLYAYIEALAKSVNLNITTIQAKDSTDTSAAKSSTPGAVAQGSETAPGTSQAEASAVRALSPTIGRIDVDLQLTGSIDSYTAFLAKLQDSLRLIDVQSVNIASAEGKSDLTFITSLSTYYQKSK